MDFQEMIGEIRKSLIMQDDEITDELAMRVIEEYVLSNSELVMKHPKEKLQMVKHIRQMMI